MLEVLRYLSQFCQVAWEANKCVHLKIIHMFTLNHCTGKAEPHPQFVCEASIEAQKVQLAFNKVRARMAMRKQRHAVADQMSGWVSFNRQYTSLKAMPAVYQPRPSCTNACAQNWHHSKRHKDNSVQRSTVAGRRAKHNMWTHFVVIRNDRHWLSQFQWKGALTSFGRNLGV